MKLREDFVVRALESGANVSELCREFGISRKTAPYTPDRRRLRSKLQVTVIAASDPAHQGGCGSLVAPTSFSAAPRAPGYPRDNS